MYCPQCWQRAVLGLWLHVQSIFTRLSSLCSLVRSSQSTCSSPVTAPHLCSSLSSESTFLWPRVAVPVPDLLWGRQGAAGETIPQQQPGEGVQCVKVMVHDSLFALQILFRK